ncbi:M61 family metallopeptidase [Mucilaginibacter myungsuensis]|uniref:M61 family metallopeptidase n=1 Tax=Mucilaginibacter myungsuensis TaxID=649104 RepID=A0A929KVC6_9SPHI|nr:PDZ domain-containing protein [Mucilaginibacter myungsuensis]MBE9661135.1 M61 family metallopeptidase [Mucilaginibacter myungsuensis]MDN3597280.1 PDZ domain-containing protein [Mucilaginibacter myungsuensis]
MKKLLLTTAVALGAAMSALAQADIKYTLSFANAAHHEAEISLTANALTAAPLKVRMSRSSAGRYATHEFGKNVYNVKAWDGAGKPLAIEQLEGDVWVVAKHGPVVKVTYTLFANWTDGTYASIDPSHAHLNMPPTMMWAVGMDARPIHLKFTDYEKYGWKFATQLKPEGAPGAYFAPNFQYMMDSPTELSNFNIASWKVKNADGKEQSIRLAIHSDDTQATIDKFAEHIKKIVLEEQAIFGELPAYDYGDYIFLDDVHPTVSGDGMEHRNSTCIVHPAEKIEGNETRLLSTYAHEFFHAWNVKRIRPKSLEPFDYSHADMSSDLWFAEGFTQYYGGLTLTRAGFGKPEDYVFTANGLINTVLTSPAALKYTPTQMSRYSVFADAGVSIDPNNNANVFTSYYTYGGAIALGLDLKLRADRGITLDDYMTAVWKTLGKNMKPYTTADLQAVLAKVTTPTYAADFFDNYVNGIKKIDYAPLLDKAGMILRKAAPGKAWAGNIGGLAQRGRSGAARTVATTSGIPLTGSTAQNSPLYKAGLDAGDTMLKADGKELADAGSLQEIISGKKPGDKISITYKNRAGEHETTLTLEESPAYEVITYEKAGKELTKDQSAFRTAWLSSKVK